MFWRTHTPDKSVPNNLEGVRAPLGLRVEIQLSEELHRCVHEADWEGFKGLLYKLEGKREALGAAAVAAIVNYRPSTKDPTALHLVCGRGGSSELAKRLLQLGADPNARATIITVRGGIPIDDRPTPLFCAAGCGDLKVAKMLMRSGARVTERNGLGETPLLLFLRTQPQWGRAWRVGQKLLLGDGAPATMPDADGITPLAEHLVRDRWIDAELVAKKAPDKLQITERARSHVLSKFIHSGLSALAQVGHDNARLRTILKVLDDLRTVMGESLVSAVINTPINEGPSLFARMIDLDVKSADLVMAESLGGSFTRSFGSRFGSTDLRGATAFHHAVASNNPGLIAWALSKVSQWFAHQPVGDQRFSALHLLYLNNEPANLSAAKLLLESGVDPRAVTADGTNLFEMAVSVGDAPGMDLWAEYLTNPYVEASPEIREMALHDEEIQRHKKEFSDFGKMRIGLPPLIEQEMKNWAGSEDAREFTKSCREYLEAYHVAKEPRRWIRNNPEMYRILPRAMMFKNPLALAGIVKAIDSLNDHDEQARGWHPFQAELMTLLTHPSRAKALAPSSDSTRAMFPVNEALEVRKLVTLALTSIHRFNNFGLFKVSPAAVDLWGRIGVRSFSFRYQKWDARGVPLGENRGLSLLETYGFSPIVGADEISSDLGAGFELGRERKAQIQRTLAPLGVKFDPNVRIQYYQGCKRASLPGVGEFVLRNSSPFFGPHLLKHPAYYSHFTAEEGLPISDAKRLTSDAIEESFMPALRATLYLPLQSSVSEMDFLLSHLEAVDDDLDLWKFDTRRKTAWETIENVGTVLKGGYYSDGFPALVQYLTRFSLALRGTGEPMPHLAFFSRGLPAWRPLPFTDLDGKEYSTLELTSETLQLLKKLQNSEADREDFRRDKGRTFNFFQMGLDQSAALVIVDGKETSHDM